MYTEHVLTQVCRPMLSYFWFELSGLLLNASFLVVLKLNVVKISFRKSILTYLFIQLHAVVFHSLTNLPSVSISCIFIGMIS